MHSSIAIKIRSEMVLAYPIPLLLSLMAWAPGDIIKGILFSPYGGLGWFLLLPSFPWLTGRILLLCLLGPASERLSRCKRALVVLLGYFPISILCAASFILALNPPLSNSLRNLVPWFYFPLSLGIDGW